MTIATTLNGPPQPTPPSRLDGSANSTHTEFEANQERVKPLMAALYKRLRLAARSRRPDGFDRDALLHLDRDAWGITHD